MGNSSGTSRYSSHQPHSGCSSACWRQKSMLLADAVLHPQKPSVYPLQAPLVMLLLQVSLGSCCSALLCPALLCPALLCSALYILSVFHHFCHGYAACVSSFIPVGIHRPRWPAFAAAVRTLTLQSATMQIRVNWAFQKDQREDTSGHCHIFMGDLSNDISHKALFDAFKHCPDCSDARVMWDQATGR